MFRAVGIYIEGFPTRNRKVETSVEILFSREIFDLQNSGVTRGNNVPTRQGIKCNRSKFSRLLGKKHRSKLVEHCEEVFCGGGAQSATAI